MAGAVLVVVWSIAAGQHGPGMVVLPSMRDCLVAKANVVKQVGVIGAHCVDRKLGNPIPDNYGGRDG